jgi:DNA-binding transcriptional regulator GbsR (MarR family)
MKEGLQNPEGLAQKKLGAQVSATLCYDHLVGETGAIYHDMSVALGISDSVSMILYTLCCENERLSLQAMCRQMGMSKQTLNSSLRHLEQEGLVQLEALNGKSKCAVLTQKGERYAVQTAMKIVQAEQNVLENWPERDVKQFIQLTERFRDDLAREAQKLEERIPERGMAE